MPGLLQGNPLETGGIELGQIGQPGPLMGFRPERLFPDVQPGEFDNPLAAGLAQFGTGVARDISGLVLPRPNEGEALTGIVSPLKFPTFGARLTRFHDPATGSLANRPQGAFFSIDKSGIQSAHSDIGSKVLRSRINTSKVLNLTEGPHIRITSSFPKVPASANIEAIRNIKGQKFLDDLLSKSSKELKQVANKMKIKFRFDNQGTEFGNKKHMLEIIGARVAKSSGFEGLTLLDKADPSFDEFVDLVGKSVDLINP